MKKLITLLLISLFAVNLAACEDKDDENQIIEPGRNPEVTITIKDYGTIKLELYPDVAPNTVNNFIKNVEDGVYTNNEFHRIIEDFMIQGGRSTGTCVIEAEVNNNPTFGGVNDLSHERGVISMARTSVYNSATSQFFIVHEDATFLDEEYAAFGMVIDGFDVLDAVAEVNTTGYPYDAPLTTVVIESITIELFGNTYDNPVCE